MAPPSNHPSVPLSSSAAAKAARVETPAGVVTPIPTSTPPSAPAKADQPAVQLSRTRFTLIFASLMVVVFLYAVSRGISCMCTSIFSYLSRPWNFLTARPIDCWYVGYRIL